MWRDRLRVRLEGRLVTLEPLAAEHLDGLRAAAADERIWRFMVTTDVEVWIEQALSDTGRVQFAVLRDGVQGEVREDELELSLVESVCARD